MIATIEIEMDFNTGDVDADTLAATEKAQEIARRLTDNEPHVDAANVISITG